MKNVIIIAKSLINLSSDYMSVVSKSIVRETPVVAKALADIKAEIVQAALDANLGEALASVEESAMAMSKAIDGLTKECKKALGIKTGKAKNRRVAHAFEEDAVEYETESVRALYGYCAICEKIHLHIVKEGEEVEEDDLELDDVAGVRALKKQYLEKNQDETTREQEHVHTRSATKGEKQDIMAALAKKGIGKFGIASGKLKGTKRS